MPVSLTPSSSLLRLRANGRNNYQHYGANNVGSCCVRVGSGVQRMQQLPTSLGPAVHRGKIQPISLWNPCVISMRGPNNVGRTVRKNCATDPTLLPYASAITEQKKCWELLSEKSDRFQTSRNNTQPRPTTCNRVCKRTQHVTSNNVGSYWPTMFRPFARGFEVFPYSFSETIPIFFKSHNLHNVCNNV